MISHRKEAHGVVTKGLASLKYIDHDISIKEQACHLYFSSK